TKSYQSPSSSCRQCRQPTARFQAWRVAPRRNAPGDGKGNEAVEPSALGAALLSAHNTGIVHSQGPPHAHSNLRVDHQAVVLERHSDPAIAEGRPAGAAENRRTPTKPAPGRAP